MEYILGKQKPVGWIGSAYHDLCAFPDSARRRAGFELYRVFYVAKFDEAVWVLHAFRKTVRKTSGHDIEIGRKRYAEMLRERKRLKALHGE